jgi:CubicO group peptidase (beta-lactamase class C family)
MRNPGFLLVFLIVTISAIKGQSFDKSGSIDSVLTSWDKHNAPGYAVAIIQNGSPIYQRFGGMANIENGTRVGSLTQFWVASVTKQFTATAIYILASQGKIDLKRSARFYLTDLPPVFERVAIDHLLHHTGGLRDGFVLTALSKKGEESYTNENVIKYLKLQRSMSFKPGTEYEYNNSGYVLLATVIEKISGLSYPEFVKQNIFIPLGMTHSYISGSYAGERSLAEGYHEVSSADQNKKYEAGHFRGNSYGSTGLITNTVDLIKWANALQDPEKFEVLKIKRSTLFANGKLASGKPIAYAGGLEKLSYAGRTVYEHFGADEGFKANIVVFPETGLSIIGLTNNGSNYELSRKLYAIADVFFGNTGTLHAAVDPGEHVISETYFYNPARTPVLKMIRRYRRHAEIRDSPDGIYVDHAVLKPNVFKSYDPIPTIYRRSPPDITIVDPYGMKKTARQFKIDTASGDLKRFDGEYYSSELEVSYKIVAKDRHLYLEFVPGVLFPLRRLTATDFVFDYSGPNFIQFSKKGFYFSRDGCRKLEFVLHGR